MNSMKVGMSLCLCFTLNKALKQSFTLSNFIFPKTLEMTSRQLKPSKTKIPKNKFKLCHLSNKVLLEQKQSDIRNGSYVPLTPQLKLLLPKTLPAV